MMKYKKLNSAFFTMIFLTCVASAQTIKYNVTDLGTLGGTRSSANAINDAGQIVGSGSIGGQTHAFLLTPVPEPSALTLQASALLGLGWVSLLRRRMD